MRADTRHARLTIDLAAIRANFRTARTLVAPNVNVTAVVKSDAYGLGLQPVAEALVGEGCNTFMVATFREALALRQVCPGITIIVLQADRVVTATKYPALRLVPVVNRDADLDRLIGTDADFPYVLNIDTGFSRFGATIGKIEAVAETGAFVRRPPGLVMSHLACSDRADDPLNRLQRDRFEAARTMLPGVPASLAASAGLWLGTEYHYDLVRVGSALYGLNNAGVIPNPLRRTLKLCARILDVRDVPAGEAVGYGADYHTRRHSRIAVAGMGYAHGLPWSAANRIEVMCGDVACPVVGRVSMEYCAVDVTDVPTRLSQPGTWVEILGEGNGLDELAQGIGINAQELVVRIGGGCARRYARGSAGWSDSERPASTGPMPSEDHMQGAW